MPSKETLSTPNLLPNNSFLVDILSKHKHTVAENKETDRSHIIIGNTIIDSEGDYFNFDKEFDFVEKIIPGTIRVDIASSKINALVDENIIEDIPINKFGRIPNSDSDPSEKIKFENLLIFNNTFSQNKVK